MQVMLRRLLLIASLLLLPGCLAYVKDITSDSQYKQYWGDYHPGVVYRLKQDAVIVDWKDHDWDFTSYIDGTPRYELFPPSDKPYDKTPIGMATAGTRLQFKRLLYHWYFEGETTYPMAFIIDGPHAGKNVMLNAVSRRHYPLWQGLSEFQDILWLDTEPQSVE